MDEPRDKSMREPDAPRGDGADASSDVGPPQPTSDRWLGTVGKTMIAVGLGGAAFLAIIGVAPHRTMGAPASARLELERRRAEIERAIAEAERVRAEEADEGLEDEGPRE